MKLSAMEKVRRAAVDAYRAAEKAHDAVWRARRALDALKATTAESERASVLTPPLRAFLVGEVDRQVAQAQEKERSYWEVYRDAGALVELLGAKENRDG